MGISDTIRQFAEEPDAQMPEPTPPAVRFIRPNFILMLDPSNYGRVSRVRTTADSLDQTIGEVRTILAEHKFKGCGWFIGPSSDPADLSERLIERGFSPPKRPPFLPEMTTMALTQPPSLPPPDHGVEARPVRSYEEFVSAVRAGMRAFGEAEDAIDNWIAAARDGWESGWPQLTHIGLADGNAAGCGMVSHGPDAIVLGGAAVLPEYRRRGVYGALVASRWRWAVEAGKPALVIQASAESRPILKRCGFSELCSIKVFLDPSLEH